MYNNKYLPIKRASTSFWVNFNVNSAVLTIRPSSAAFISPSPVLSEFCHFYFLRQSAIVELDDGKQQEMNSSRMIDLHC